VLAALEQHDVDYVLVGGLALGVHGLVRATRDIDVFVRPTSENVERLRAALRSVFDDPSSKKSLQPISTAATPSSGTVRQMATSSST